MNKIVFIQIQLEHVRLMLRSRIWSLIDRGLTIEQIEKVSETVNESSSVFKEHALETQLPAWKRCCFWSLAQLEWAWKETKRGLHWCLTKCRPGSAHHHHQQLPQ